MHSSYNPFLRRYLSVIDSRLLSRWRNLRRNVDNCDGRVVEWRVRPVAGRGAITARGLRVESLAARVGELVASLGGALRRFCCVLFWRFCFGCATSGASTVSGENLNPDASSVFHTASLTCSSLEESWTTVESLSFCGEVRYLCRRDRCNWSIYFMVSSIRCTLEMRGLLATEGTIALSRLYSRVLLFWLFSPIL